MAIGDLASQAGLPLVPGTAQASDLDQFDNETRDMIARIILSNPGRISVGPTAPTALKLGDVWIRTSV